MTGGNASVVGMPELQGISASDPRLRTNIVERGLLVALVMLLPFEESVPTYGGFSVMYLAFAAIGVYMAMSRPGALIRVILHPVVFAAYTMIAIAAGLEAVSELRSFYYLIRFAQMIGGAIVVASLCRDRLALRYLQLASLASACGVAVMLFFSSYSTLSAAHAANFGEASVLRGEVMSASIFDVNANRMAVMAAQGAMLALCYGLFETNRRRRILFFGTATVIAVAATLPMSRSGIANLVLCVLGVLFVYRSQRIKTIVAVFALASLAAAWVPDAVLARMKFGEETVSSQGNVDAREQIYVAAITNVDEYILVGVGAGNFWTGWGKRKGFWRNDHVAGAHNSFVQIAIFWGIAALAAFVWMLVLCFRSLPRPFAANEQTLALYGLAISIAVWLMVSHNFYAKLFSLAIGQWIASGYWIWPAHKRSAR